ncbi:hypothetical protein DYB31_015953 [Aphanomyces astaci]|uniref:FAD-dependent oxidoreductase 2 FAD-binding domain-containing protein n=1 Tax=Aphanomyces astaci TaxID=112090 RepID=A0A397FNU6_APHAT|nr:hypothetical protein DYB31_015953 [Aphanomyces astaci]
MAGGSIWLTLIIVSWFAALHFTDPTTADIVIIGGGLAGMTAALEALEANASLRIVLLEKEPKVGGNSAKASSGINAAQSKDDLDAYLQDTLKSGGGFTNPVLAQTLVDQLGGHSTERTRRNKTGPNVGFAITSALKKAIDDASSQIQIVTGAKVTKLVASDNAVSGVEYHVDNRDFTVSTPAVILATGT